MCLCARTSTLAGLMKDASPLSADLASPDFTAAAATTLLGWKMEYEEMSAAYHTHTHTHTIECTIIQETSGLDKPLPWSVQDKTGWVFGQTDLVRDVPARGMEAETD